jgi:hypothetical protein
MQTCGHGRYGPTGCPFNGLVLAAPFAHDAHESRRKRAERLVEGLGAARQRVVVVGSPMALGDRTGGHAASFARPR